MESEISNSSSDETHESSAGEEPAPKRGRGRGRGRGRAQQNPLRIRLHRQNEEEIIVGLRRKKERLREIVGELKKNEMKSILIQTIERNPDVLWDVLDCGRFDGTQGNSSGPSQDPSPPAPSSPSWCTCSNCREMPQEDEKVCCGKLPDYCLSNIPHFQLIALDENVLQVANIYRNDILAYPLDVDLNRGYRHAAYRQFVMWVGSGQVFAG